MENEAVEKIEQAFQPRNRAERRAMEKMNRKKNSHKKYFTDNLSQYFEKMAFIDMIQKLREINKENEENGCNDDEEHS